MAGKRTTDLPAAGTLTGDEPVEVAALSTSVTITALTISAAAGDNSLNDSALGFVAAGFAVGDRVNVEGFPFTLYVGTITVLTTAKMTIGGADGDVISTQAAGPSVTISKWESLRATAQEIAALGGVGGLFETATKFRLLTTADGSGGSVGWGEVQFTDQNGVLLVDGGTATASTSAGGHPAADAHDGSFATYWEYNGIEAAVGSWWQFEYDNPHLVGQILVRPGTGQQAKAPEGFDVQYWSEQTAGWVALGSFTPTWATDDGQAFSLSSSLPVAVLEDAPVDGNTYGRKDGDWIELVLTGAPAPVITVAAADTDLAATQASKYIRFTNAAAKTYTVLDDATEPLPDDGEWHLRNAGAGDLTIIEDGGVTINVPAGGTHVLEEGMTVTLKRVAEDEFDLLGQTVPA